MHECTFEFFGDLNGADEGIKIFVGSIPHVDLLGLLVERAAIAPDLNAEMVELIWISKGVLSVSGRFLRYKLPSSVRTYLI